METITPGPAYSLSSSKAWDAICLVNVYDLICPQTLRLSLPLETWSCIESIRFQPNTSSWRNLRMSHHLFQWLQSFTASNPAPIECCGINFLHLNIIGPFGEISCQIEEGLIVKWGGFKNSGLIVTTLPLTLFCWLILMQFNHTACCPGPQRFTNYPLIRAEVCSSLLGSWIQTPRASWWGEAKLAAKLGFNNNQAWNCDRKLGVHDQL